MIAAQIGFVEIDMQLFCQNRFTVQLEIKIQIKTKPIVPPCHLIFYLKKHET
jgi:hypothetical protein